MEKPQLTIDDAAVIIGRLAMENFQLAKAIDQIEAEQAKLREQLRKVTPNLVIVERQEDHAPASDQG